MFRLLLLRNNSVLDFFIIIIFFYKKCSPILFQILRNWIVISDLPVEIEFCIFIEIFLLLFFVNLEGN